MNTGIIISPNPFTEQTEISLSLDGLVNIRIDLFDNMGHHIKTLANFISTSTEHKQTINFRQLGLKTGMYYISIAINGKVTNTKVAYTG